MSSYACPYCRELVSPRAENCPHCGEPLIVNGEEWVGEENGGYENVTHYYAKEKEVKAESAMTGVYRRMGYESDLDYRMNNP